MCREACAAAAGRQEYAPAVGLSLPDELRPRERVRPAVSEPEANAGGGGEGGRVEEAERKPILHVGPEGAEIAVEALGEFIVGDEGEGALPAAAAAALGAGAAGVGAGGEAVLMVAVEGGHQIELRRGRIFHPAPEHGEDLVVVVGGVGANGDHIAADGEGADRERAVGIGELDVLIAGKERRSPAEPERPHHRVTGVVGDSGPEGVTRRIPQRRERGYLRGSEWGGGDGVVLLGVVRIDGEPCELEPQLQLGFEFAGLSVDAYYAKKYDAIATAPLTAAQVATLPALGYSPSNSLRATISDNTSYSVMGSFGFSGGPTLFAGYEHIKFANPNSPLPVGSLTIGGYVIAVRTNTAYDNNKILTVFWGGVKYPATPQLDLMAAFYCYHSDSFATGANTGCSGTQRSGCSGRERSFSLVADYKFAKRFDGYLGTFWTDVQDGLAFGFLNTSTLTTTAGVRFRF